MQPEQSRYPNGLLFYTEAMECAAMTKEADNAKDRRNIALLVLALGVFTYLPSTFKIKEPPGVLSATWYRCAVADGVLVILTLYAFYTDWRDNTKIPSRLLLYTTLGNAFLVGAILGSLLI